MTWDPIRWLNDFRGASAVGAGLRELRREAFLGTAAAVIARKYSCEGSAIHLDDTGQYDALHRGTAIYHQTDDLVIPEFRPGEERRQARYRHHRRWRRRLAGSNQADLRGTRNHGLYPRQRSN